jgi:hypothetical protein
LELTHGINGIRNTAKNKIQEIVGGRKDYKIDCLAAEFKDWEISWKLADGNSNRFWESAAEIFQTSGTGLPNISNPLMSCTHFIPRNVCNHLVSSSPSQLVFENDIDDKKLINYSNFSMTELLQKFIDFMTIKNEKFSKSVSSRLQVILFGMCQDLKMSKFSELIKYKKEDFFQRRKFGNKTWDYLVFCMERFGYELNKNEMFIKSKLKH